MIIKSPKAALATYFGKAQVGEMDEHLYCPGRFTKHVYQVDEQLYCAAKAETDEQYAQPVPTTYATRERVMPIWEYVKDDKAKYIRSLGYDIFKFVKWEDAPAKRRGKRAFGSTSEQ